MVAQIASTLARCKLRRAARWLLPPFAAGLIMVVGSIPRGSPVVGRMPAMPDWSYRPLFRPLLFRLPAAPARALTLGVMGTLARLPGGRALIDGMGHLAPP